MSATKTNILMTCGGKWVGHILQLRDAARSIPAMRQTQILVADREAITPAGQFADGSFQVPSIDNAAYTRELLRGCQEHGIGIVVSIVDPDVLRLSQDRELFAAEGVNVAVPPVKITRLCFDKRVFYDWAQSRGLPVPRVFSRQELPHVDYPIFAKPSCGFGSIGARRCDLPQEALCLAADNGSMLFQEFLAGREYTCDGYVNRAGKCIVCVVRIRDKVVGGEAYQSHTVRDAEVSALARRTMEALAAEGHRGPINVQIIKGQHSAVIDVNPRLGSACLLSNQATDGRLFRSLLREALGETVDGNPDDYRAGIFLKRFLGEVFYDQEHVIGIYPQPPEDRPGVARPHFARRFCALSLTGKQLWNGSGEEP